MALTKRQYTVAILLGIMLVLGVVYVVLLPRYTLPKIIWEYWHDANVPPIVQQMLDHRRRILKSWTFHHVTNSTLRNYVDDVPRGFADLKESHKSDWIRLALLKKYGGCWLDASIIVNSEDDMNRLYENSIAQQVDFTGFYTERAIVDKDPKTFVESWFMLAPKGSQVIQRCYDEYTQAIDMGFEAYSKHIQNSVPHIRLSHIYNNGSVYLTVYACLQVALHTTNGHIVLLKSADTMYRLHELCYDESKKDYDSVCIVKKIRDDPATRQIPYIKLTHAQRNAMDSVDISSYFV